MSIIRQITKVKYSVKAEDCRITINDKVIRTRRYTITEL